MFLIIFIVILIYLVVKIGSGDPESKKDCDQRNEPHKWIESLDSVGGHYLHCSECNLIPNNSPERMYKVKEK